MHTNKVHCVYTIDRVARELGITVDLVERLSDGLEVEDGIIVVYALDDEEGTTSFTDYGVEQLKFLLGEYRSRNLALDE